MDDAIGKLIDQGYGIYIILVLLAPHIIEAVKLVIYVIQLRKSKEGSKPQLTPNERELYKLIREEINPMIRNVSLLTERISPIVTNINRS